MRKVIVFVGMIGLYSFCSGAGAVYEQPINNQESAGCISISTTTWTSIPTTAYGPRVGLYVTVVSSAAANMAAHVGTTSAPTLTTTSWPIVLKPSVTQFHGVSSASIFYVLSLNAGIAPETVCYQEVRQQ